MLLYEYRIRKQLARISSYAESLQSKFEAAAPVAELLADAENLSALWDAFAPTLPEGFAEVSSMGRHLWWMKKRLKEGSPEQCKGDIEDIVKHDLPTIESNFNAWLEHSSHFDTELVSKTSDLVAMRQLDSAVRKAFVILTARLRTLGGVTEPLDGAELVNKVFGKSAPSTLPLDDATRQGLRDLLAGLYSIYRNTYAHEDVHIEWYEADGIIAAINMILLQLQPPPEKESPF
jgi:hypothetical protein